MVIMDNVPPSPGPAFGGRLQVGEIKDFLNASYEPNPPKTLNGYILDEKLSNLYGKVYHDDDDQKLVVAHRGTVEPSDWANNAMYALGAYKLTNRYKKGQKMQKGAEKKYNKYDLETLGHSQGAVLARELGKNGEVITLNPASKAEKQQKNEYDIRSSLDVVSALKAPQTLVNSLLQPKKTSKHNIVIPAETSNPLTEHKIDILNRLPQDMDIGE